MLKRGNVPPVSRRTFLGGTAALGAAVLVPGAMEAAAAATPKRGGLFRLGLAGGATTDGFEPGSIWDTVMQNISAQTRSMLVEILPNGQLDPALAESWEASPDARIWTFRLRQGVEFHNGKTLDAEDVIFSINHHLGPDSTSQAKAVTQGITDIKADGKLTVVVILEGPNSDFPFVLSDYHLPIVPAGTTNWDAGIGTGAYVLQSFDPGVRALVKRNPNFWRSDRGFFDEVETLVVNDTGARMNALVSGEVHAINRADLKTIGLLERNSELAVQNIEGWKHFTLPMLTDTPPYDNNEVRLALKWAIDRQQLVDTVLRGYGRVGNDHPIAAINRYHNPDLPQREFDPDKAKFHMKKSGLAGQAFELHISDAAFNGAVDAAVLYQESAAKAGINIQPIREPADGYWSRVWMNLPWCGSFWSGRPTEDAIFTLAFGRDSDSNDARWDNDRFNKLLVAARGELDDDKRRPMYYEMQQIVRDEGGVVIPIFINHVQATSAKVATGTVAGNGEMDGDRCAERWWFA